MDEIYGELLRIAARHLASERREISLQPADLVHEAYLKVERMPDFAQCDRGSTLALLANQMRFILIDHAKAKKTQKRDAGGPVLRLHSGVLGRTEDPIEALALDEALTRLEQRRPRVARVFIERYFGGLTVAEIAGGLGVSERTVKEDWRYARAWILEQLGFGDRQTTPPAPAE